MKGIVMIFSLCLIIISCEEKVLDESAPPSVIPKAEYNVEVRGSNFTVSPMKVLKAVEGSNVNLSIITSPGWIIVSVVINGTSVSATGTNFSYSIYGIKDHFILDIVTKPEIVVVVPTRTDTLTLLGWFLIENKYYWEGSWSTSNLSDSQKTNRICFKASYDYFIFDKDSIYTGLGGKWSWVGLDSIKLGGEKYRYFLTNTSLNVSGRDGTISSRYERKLTQTY